MKRPPSVTEQRAAIIDLFLASIADAERELARAIKVLQEVQAVLQASGRERPAIQNPTRKPDGETSDY